MIHDALRLIINQLNRYLSNSGDGDAVVLGNIAAADSLGESAGAGNLNRVVLSLVNVTEDHTLKNNPPHRREGSRIVFQNPPVHLYLYLLFSANHSLYSSALRQLSRIIEFFQGKSAFTVRNSPDLTEVSRPPDELAGLRLILELQSLTFEQVNHLWGSLGGKQVPFALYRARLLSLSAGEIDGTGEPIDEIALDIAGQVQP